MHLCQDVVTDSWIRNHTMRVDLSVINSNNVTIGTRFYWDCICCNKFCNDIETGIFGPSLPGLPFSISSNFPFRHKFAPDLPGCIGQFL